MAHDGIPDRDTFAKLQAGFAATLERADRAETQLRTATEESLRLLGRIDLLQQDLADARRELARSREETVAVTALAATHGARAVDLERAAVALREKSYMLEQDLAATVAERDRLKNEQSGARLNLNDMVVARNQLLKQLEDASKQHARSVAAATAAEDRHKAEAQQLQVRLAASEAECRALVHAKATTHEDLQRARTDALALQAQVQEEFRQREEHSSECRRLHCELEAATEALAQAQRAQRATAGASEELQEEVERLRAAHAALKAELQAANENLQRLQEEARLAAERNTDLAGQLHGLSASLRHLEVENARLTDGHATLRIELEARAAEARAAKGEAAGLAADRARLLAELQRKPADVQEDEVSRLREALTASQLNVARLQRELAANDAVLADAESALVTLVSEKESLQQALSDALMSERVAINTAEELKCKVAALAGQGDAGAQEGVANCAGIGPSALGGNKVDQRMISYLQSLPDGGSMGRTSGSGHEQSVATTAALASPGFESASSSMVAAAGVRMVGPPAPAPAAPRYPAQHALSTSESESMVPPVYRNGGHRDAWEAISAAGTDSSGKESVSGGGSAHPARVGLPSVTSLVIVVPPMSVGAAPAQGGIAAPPHEPEQGAPAALGDGSGIAALVGGDDAEPAVPSASNVPGSSLFCRSAIPAPVGLWSQDDDLAAACAARSSPAGPSAAGNASSTTPKLGPPTPGPADEVVAGIPTGSTSSARRGSHLPPRSPHISIGDLREPRDAQVSPSPAYADIGLRGLGGSRASNGPRSLVASPAAIAATPSIRSTPPNRLRAGGFPLQEMSSAPALEVFRTPPLVSAALSAYQSSRIASAEAESPLPSGSPVEGGYATAASTGARPGAADTGISGMSAVLSFRGLDSMASALAQPAASSEPICNPQSGTHRSPSGVGTVAPRAGWPGGWSGSSPAEETDPGAANGLAGLRGPGAGSGSPMMSPRLMLEARMLSRAVRPSAEALSSPIRPGNLLAAPGVVPMVAVADAAAVAVQQTVNGEGFMVKASLTPTQTSSVQLQVGRQAQPLASRKPNAEAEELSGCPSPFASGNVAATVASPGASGAAPAPSPGSVKDVELPSQRITMEQQSFGSSPAAAATASYISGSISSSRCITLTPERGFVSSAALSSQTAIEDGQLERTRTLASDEVPRLPLSCELAAGFVAASSVLLAPAPSEEDVMLLKKLAAMDEALRAIGAV